mmetsp:Transcript_21776/g.47617  ORF Transcript_21776/g.47617 Transcript_21776/m.47617 type:complete len:121 (-) Transcript_21776:419-781(-)
MPCKPFPFKINAGDPFRICSCAALSPASRYKLVPFFLGTQIVSDDDKLAAYRWFKQATVGDIDIPQPKILDFNWAARQKVRDANAEWLVCDSHSHLSTFLPCTVELRGDLAQDARVGLPH